MKNHILMFKTIQTDEEYNAPCKRAYDLAQLDLTDESPELLELEHLGEIIEAYQDEHHPIEPPSDAEMLKFALDQRGYQVYD